MVRSCFMAAEIRRLADRSFPRNTKQCFDHPDADGAADVRLAVAWHPPADAFDHYPNLKAVCSIGAGVDNILRCPSLRDDIRVVRVMDPAQAQMCLVL
jgi:glyoxylate/hydroxypyruvate reductase A